MKWTTLLLIFGALLHLSHAQLSDTEEVGAEEEEHVELFTTPRTKMAAATSDFGYNLFRALAAQNPNANIFLAPTSISAALTQLSMGTSERGQRQLYRALRYHTLQDPQFHDTLKELLASVTAPGKGLSAAARVYIARRLRVKLDFLDAVERQYGVRPKAIMGGTKEVKDINDWVKQTTGGKVDRFITGGIPRGFSVNAMGAAYFKGKWLTRFSQSGAMAGFQLDGEAPVQVSTLKQENYPVKMGIDSDLGCTIAQIQMQDSVSMFVFLPDDVTKNMSLIEETLTAEFVQDLSMTLHPAQVSLCMPVLKLSYSTDLLPLLSDLGLSDWLADAELVKITDQPAKLSTVRHKVVMEMVPEGSQYATSGSSPLPLSYCVNRPFLYLIRDEPSGALLFIGKVVNPKDLKI